MKYINTLTFAYELSIVDDALNGYKNNEFNLLALIDNKWLQYIYSNNIPLSLGYNHHTAKNYIHVTMSFLPTMTEEQIKELEAESTLIIKALDLKTQFPKIEKELVFAETAEIVKYTDKEELVQFIPVRFLFGSVEDIKVYERFSKSKIMRHHIDFMCTVNNLGKRSWDVPYEKLPIHDIELSTNTLLIHNKIVPLFRTFKVASDYILKNEENQLEFEIAKLMLMSTVYGEFVISNLVSITEKSDMQKITNKIVKKGKSIINKNGVPEKYHNALVEDLAELFGIEPVNEFLTETEG